MGTRSLTFVIGEGGEKIVNMYRQMDGYPSGHGQDLYDFLKDIVMVNGICFSERNKKIANGAGCLAAQLVAHFKDGPGGIYLEPVKAVNFGQEYEYHITTHGEGQGLTIACFDIRCAHGDGPVRRHKLFDGTVEAFAEFCRKQA